MNRYRRNNFVFLLGGLLSLFLSTSAVRLSFDSERELDLMRSLLMFTFSLFTIVSVWSLARESRWFHVGLGLSGLTTGMAMVALLFHSRAVELIAVSLLFVFSALSCYIAGRHVFALRDTDANTLIGAVCVYLLLGLLWALIYLALALIWPDNAFQGLSSSGSLYYFDNLLYFSFVTLTTVGYGDITPLNPIVRSAAYLEMVTGQFYMAILVSGLVAHFMGQRIGR